MRVRSRSLLFDETAVHGFVSSSLLTTSLNIVHSCAVLRLAPGDIDALKAKLVLLIEVSRFDEALLLLSDASLTEQAPFEKVLAKLDCSLAFLRPSLHCSHTASLLGCFT